MCGWCYQAFSHALLPFFIGPERGRRIAACRLHNVPACVFVAHNSRTCCHMPCTVRAQCLCSLRLGWLLPANRRQHSGCFGRAFRMVPCAQLRSAAVLRSFRLQANPQTCVSISDMAWVATRTSFARLTSQHGCDQAGPRPCVFFSTARQSAGPPRIAIGLWQIRPQFARRHWFGL